MQIFDKLDVLENIYFVANNRRKSIWYIQRTMYCGVVKHGQTQKIPLKNKYKKSNISPVTKTTLCICRKYFLFVPFTLLS